MTPPDPKTATGRVTHRWKGPLHLTLHRSYCGAERRWIVRGQQYDVDTIDGEPVVQFHEMDNARDHARQRGALQGRALAGRGWRW